jgi:hypothetical protein
MRHGSKALFIITLIVFCDNLLEHSLRNTLMADVGPNNPSNGLVIITIIQACVSAVSAAALPFLGAVVISRADVWLKISGDIRDTAPPPVEKDQFKMSNGGLASFYQAAMRYGPVLFFIIAILAIMVGTVVALATLLTTSSTGMGPYGENNNSYTTLRALYAFIGGLSGAVVPFALALVTSRMDSVIKTNAVTGSLK